jgi:hypothetical protein|tara:strand:+ start:333 stop:596 length:264 start_codon:yes stop_codon:yes gene_type:complete
MKKEREIEIKKEAVRRVGLWLDNASFNEMTAQGSYMRFNMSLGLLGYPFVLDTWMDKADFDRFITDSEFYSETYDIIITEVFNKYNK